MSVFAVFMPTPCPLSSLPSALLAWVLSVANEVMTHIHAHTLQFFGFFFPPLALQQHFPVSNGSLYPRMTTLCYRHRLQTHTQVLCPRCLCFQTTLWTASVLNLLDLLLIYFPVFLKETEPLSPTFKQLNALLPPVWTNPINTAQLIAAP